MRSFHWTNSDMYVAAFAIGILAISNWARADFRFGVPVNLGSPPNSTYADVMPSVSSDGLEVYFWSNRPGGFGDWDLWVSTRASREDGWLPATNLGETVNSGGIEGFPCISAEGLELYFSRGSESAADLMVARRNAKTQPWGRAENLGAAVNSPAGDYSPRLTGDGLELYFVSTRAGGHGLSDLWVTKRPTPADKWGPPANLSTVNSANHDQWVNLSGDGLTLLFQSDRAGAQYGGLHMSRRRSMYEPWAAPVYLGLPMSDSVYTLSSSLSSDGTMLYLSDHINYAPRAGGLGSADMWQVSLLPIVDFDGDGKTGMQDLLRLIDSWGQDDPLVDVGPTAFGDGVVDSSDLKVLMGHWGQEVDDPSLVAHWPLDETDGIVVPDYAGANDGVIIGVAQWRPQGGTIDGALELNGMTFVTADSPLSPGAGPFSILAWIKGGAPGQAIISQGGSVNWLMADPATGALMTELSSGGRTARGLSSQTIITDGNWHRIAFTWDGASRQLCVDNILVAEDAQNSLAHSWGKLTIGCDKNMTPGSFWSGLIDDVRIYSRAVKP